MKEKRFFRNWVPYLMDNDIDKEEARTYLTLWMKYFIMEQNLKDPQDIQWVDLLPTIEEKGFPFYQNPSLGVKFSIYEEEIL